MNQPPWSEAEWLGQVTTWIHDQLARQGIAVTGAIEQPHVRPWSTVLCIPTAHGVIYFKAVTPLLANEPAIVDLLAQWRPANIPRLLAVDVEQRWMLMADGGTRLRTLLESDHDIRHWERLLPLYAELQIETAQQVDRFLALGALDRRLAVLPSGYQELISDLPLLRVGQSDGLTPEQVVRLNDIAPRYRDSCEQLAALGIPEALDHNDFHDGNILVREHGYIFFDWGDSCIGHPFCSMLVALRNVADTLGLEDTDPALDRLRDIYLEPWTQFGPRADLLLAFKLAWYVGMICRALTWRTAMLTADEASRAQFAYAVPAWLEEFLHARENE